MPAETIRMARRKRIALIDTPIACNRATADFVLSSPLMEQEYARQLVDLGSRLRRPSLPEA